MNSKYIWLLTLILVLTACSDDNGIPEKPATPPPALTVGDLDFSTYVAVGASFTAGFTDGALFKAAQENSYVNILAKQFAKANGGEFTQPLMNDNTGALLLNTTPITDYRFVFDGSGPVRLNKFLTLQGAPVPPPTTNAAVNLKSTFNNMGVPGAKSFHLVAPGYGNAAGILTGKANPFFARFASSPTTTATVLGDAAKQKPTFFTVSDVGGNDVLSYAIAGGDGKDQTGNTDAATYGPNDITDPSLFGQVINTIITTFTANGAKGVIATIPYITNLPHFTTVPHNPVPMDKATASLVNNAYKEYNDALLLMEKNKVITTEEREKRTIQFMTGQNAVVILDEDLTDLTKINPKLVNMRQATMNDLLVLPSSSFIGTLADPNNPLTANGVAIPLADKWVLTPEEQLAITTATNAYNTTITTLADNNPNLALIDLNPLLEQAATSGLLFDNYSLTTNLVTGGLIGLDGIHLTSRGYALLANKFLEAIDSKFGSNFIKSLTVAKAADYPTNYAANLP